MSAGIELGQRPSRNEKDIPSIDHEEMAQNLAKAGAVASIQADTALELFGDGQQSDSSIDPTEDKRLLRKVDFLILPYISVCMAFFYIDKTTLSYAAIFGIVEDLNLKGTQFSWLSSIFYFGFLAWALPTNLLLQRFPIGKYIGVNIFLWGAFLMLQAVCHNFTTLAVLRAISGAAEACADPAFMLITGMWYTREEQPIRLGIWYSAIGIGVALGGVLGYGIGQIRGSLPSWKYEFLVIGALCSAWGIVIFFFLPDSPVNAKWLTRDQRRRVVERLKVNQTGVENKRLKPYQVKEAFTDYKTSIFFLLGIVCTIPNGGISNFGTIIIKGFGFSTLVTTLMQIPYGALICVFILACVYFNSHFHNKRSLIIIIWLIPTLIGGLGMAYLPSGNRAGRLICYYLTAGYHAAFIMLLGLQIANIAGHTKKVVTSAIFFIGYSAGNIAGPFFYKADQHPHYPLGIWSLVVCSILEMVLVGLLGVLLRYENKKRDRAQSQMAGGLEGRDLNATAFLDLTDRENIKCVPHSRGPTDTAPDENTANVD